MSLIWYVIREVSVCRLYFDLEFGISQGLYVPNLVHVSNLVYVIREVSVLSLL